MSANALTMPRRTPGKPGRFEPSEPLHMTTRRHAARSGHANGTPSINGSLDDEYSRQGSFDDGRPTTSQSLGSQQSIRSRRISDESYNGASDVNDSIEELKYTEQRSARPKTKESSPVRSSPTRKRKRSSQTPPETPHDRLTISGASAHHAVDSFVGKDSFEDVAAEHQVFDHDSDGSEDSVEDISAYHHLALKASTELTPADSQIVSPISETSNADIVTPGKPTILVVDDTGSEQKVRPANGDEIEDIVEGDDVDEADEMDDVDDQIKVDEDGRPRRRVYGRRRADHHVPEIEAAMRRQAQLKSAFRAITRALKPVLAEIALKTTEQLETDATAHEKAREFVGTEAQHGVNTRLRQAFETRKAQLDAQLRWNRKQLDMTMQAETRSRLSAHKVQIEDAREAHLDQLQHLFLCIARQAQLKTSKVSNETEDEDADVVAKLKGMSYRFKRTGTLDCKYDSRSRVALDTQRAIEDLQARFEMHQMLHGVEDVPRSKKTDIFTYTDYECHEAALSRREAGVNLHTLAVAAEEHEEMERHREEEEKELKRTAKLIKIIPNEEAVGLSLLGDLASRPGILLDKHDVDQATGRSYSQQMPPPPMHRPAIPFELPNHEASPRNSSRFEPYAPAMSQLPPSRRESLPHMSPSSAHMMSPASSAGRAASLAPMAPKQHGNEEDSRRGYYIQQPAQDVFGPPIVRSDRPSSSHSSIRDNEDSPWDHYRRPLFSLDPMLRHLPPPNRTLEFSRGGPFSGPLVIERIDTSEPRPASHRHHETIKEEAHNQAPPRSMLPKFIPTPAIEVPDNQQREQMSAPVKTDSTKDSSEPSKPQASRPNTVNLSAADFNGTKTRAPRQSRHKGVKINFGTTTKTSKSDRNGASRRAFKATPHTAEKRPTHGSPPRDAGPSIHRFRLNTESRPKTPQRTQPWQDTQQVVTSIPAPQSEHFYHGPAYGPHPAPGSAPMSYRQYGPYPPENSQPPFAYTHHSVASGPPPHAPPPPGSSWQQPPPSPRYAVPPLSQASEQPWHMQQQQQQQHQHQHQHPSQQYPPLPSPRAGPPPGFSPPAVGASQSPYGHLGAPPLAPATQDSRGWYNSAPGTQSHGVPAFAQQQRQQDGNIGHHRRRTNSDTHKDAKFQQWTPRR